MRFKMQEKYAIPAPDWDVLAEDAKTPSEPPPADDAPPASSSKPAADPWVDEHATGTDNGSTR